MTAAIRQKALRERRKQQNLSRESFWLTETAQEAFKRLRQAYPQDTRDRLIERALDALLSLSDHSDTVTRSPAQPLPDHSLKASTEQPTLLPDHEVKPLEFKETGLPDHTSEVIGSLPPVVDHTPADRKALAEIGHRLRRQGMSATEIAADWNSRGWTPNKVPKEPGAAPRRDSPSQWTLKLISQLLRRDHAEK